jgi:tRNA A37 N6-isopentenylltransferase MiaA
MYIRHNEWEYTTEIKNGMYILKKVDPETRDKQLKEFKEKQKRELKKELNKIDILF